MSYARRHATEESATDRAVREQMIKKRMRYFELRDSPQTKQISLEQMMDELKRLGFIGHHEDN